MPLCSQVLGDDLKLWNLHGIRNDIKHGAKQIGRFRMTVIAGNNSFVKRNERRLVVP